MKELSFQKAEQSDLDFIKSFLKSNELPYKDLKIGNVELFLTYKNSDFAVVSWSNLSENYPEL